MICYLVSALQCNTTLGNSPSILWMVEDESRTGSQFTPQNFKVEMPK